MQKAPAFAESKEWSSGDDVFIGNTRYDISVGKVITTGKAVFEIYSRGTGSQKGILNMDK